MTLFVNAKSLPANNVPAENQRINDRKLLLAAVKPLIFLAFPKSYNYTSTMSNVHNDNEHSVNRSNRKIAPVFVYPALRVMYSTATPCRVSIVTLDGKEATSGISSTPIKL